MANQNLPNYGRRFNNPSSRHFLFLTLFLIVPLLFISVVPASAEDAQFRANPEHTGVYGNGGTEPGNTELWRFATGAGVYSAPAVANGVVYVGSEDKNLYAIDAATGKEKWRFTTGEHVFVSPTVADGVVYVGSEDKNLYAVDVATGKEKWRTSKGDWVYSAPAVANGVVYVGNEDKRLYAIDAVTGEEKWRFATGDRVVSSPADSRH
jgi:glucose dehydrogenase